MKSAAILSLVLLATPALAYTDEQARLCTSDAFRLCGAYIPDVEQITVCMRKQKASLSAECKSVFDKPDPSAVQPVADKRKPS